MADERKKYTTKAKQDQLIGGVTVKQGGGDLSPDEIKAIIADPYGKDLIRKEYLSIEGVKKEDVEEKNGKPSEKPKPAPAPQLSQSSVQVARPAQPPVPQTAAPGKEGAGKDGSKA